MFKLQQSTFFFSILKIRNLINKLKPDVCFSTISHTNVALFIASKLARYKCKIFLRESNNLFKSIRAQSFLYFLFFFFKLVKISYKNSILITPSKQLSLSLKKKFGIKNKVFYLYNQKSLKIIMNKLGYKIEYLSSINKIDALSSGLNHIGF